MVIGKEKIQTPTLKLGVKAALLRTQDAMQQDIHKQAPEYPGSDITHHAFAAGEKGVKPFLPMMGAKMYVERKARAYETAATSKGLKKSAFATALLKPVAPVILKGANFEGAAAVHPAPPDTHGAVGVDEFVEVTNSNIDIYQKSDPTSHTSMSLAAFFGYFTQALFDPRVVYDRWWNRWIVTADAFPESSTVQNHFIAISTTPSATGSYWIYGINVTFNSGDFWDFPQLGMDQDAIIITANVFDAQGNFSADMFAVAKARLYNGWGFSVPVFTGLVGTLAPPIVLDQNADTFLIAAQPSGDALQLYTLHNSSTQPSLIGPDNVPITPVYDMPPPAPQPGATDPADLLDTGDSRFVNASTQSGNLLWQVHTINQAGLARPKYYQIDTGSKSILQSAFFSTSNTSYDFNASIAANSDNDMFVTWTSTDPAASTDVEVRCDGCDHSNGACSPGPGTLLFTSSTVLTDDFDPRFGLQRWGDYSAVTVDPVDSRQAWVVNEEVDSTSTWGSRIANIGF